MNGPVCDVSQPIRGTICPVRDALQPIGGIDGPVFQPMRDISVVAVIWQTDCQLGCSWHFPYLTKPADDILPNESRYEI